MFKRKAQKISQPRLIVVSDILSYILNRLQQRGARGLIVGGAVRDAISGIKPKDIDVEVYNVSLDQLEALLTSIYQEMVERARATGVDRIHGGVDAVGKKFGVIKFTDPWGRENYDFSVPRRDSLVGVGHKAFRTEFDPSITPKEAASRRDFTINCFSGETKIITRGGVYSICDLVGKEYEVLNCNGEWVKAPIVSGGIQNLMKITLGRNGIEKHIYATPNHRWFIRDHHTGLYDKIRLTKDLIRGHRLPSVYPKYPEKHIDAEAVCRGFVFGDGSLTYGARSITSHANFCEEKDQYLLPFFNKLDFGNALRKYSNFSRISSLPPDWKVDYPILKSNSVSYLYSWLSGYFAANGCVDTKGCPVLGSCDINNIEYVMELCQNIGIGIYNVTTIKGSGYSKDGIYHILSFVSSTLSSDFFVIPEHRNRFNKEHRHERKGWSVVNVESTERFEEVYCAMVPNTHTFVLDGNILTSNSIAYDPLEDEGTLYDFFGGVEDLRNKVLRATSPAFAEDPLRVLRGMQFAARFGMDVDDETAEMCRGLADKLLAAERNPKTEYIATLSRERVAEEFMKLVTKGKHPGSALEFLQKTGWIRFFPDFEAMFGVQQEHDYHPEGDVAEHTKHVANAAARIAERDGLTGDDRAVLVLAAMFHDIAKPESTVLRPNRTKTPQVRAVLEELQIPTNEIDNIVRRMGSHREPMSADEFRAILLKYGVPENVIANFLKWTSWGHEAAGGPKAAAILKEIGIKSDIIKRVERLISQHLAHMLRYRPESGARSVRTLAHELGPASIEDLARLIEADHSGRPPLPEELPAEAQDMLERARQEGVNLRGTRLHELVPGDVIMRFFGGLAGPWIGDIQKGLMERYLKGEITRAGAQEALYEQLRRYGRFTPVINGSMLTQVEPRERKNVLEAALRAQSTGELTEENRDAWLANYITTHYPPTTARWYSDRIKVA